MGWSTNASFRGSRRSNRTTFGCRDARLPPVCAAPGFDARAVVFRGTSCGAGGKAGAPGVLLGGLDSSNPPSPPLGRTQRPCPSRDHRDREQILCGTTTIRVPGNPRGWSFRESAMGRISDDVKVAPILPIVSHSIGVDRSTILFESSTLVPSRQTSHRLNRSLPGVPPFILFTNGSPTHPRSHRIPSLGPLHSLARRGRRPLPGSPGIPFGSSCL